MLTNNKYLSTQLQFSIKLKISLRFYPGSGGSNGLGKYKAPENLPNNSTKDSADFNNGVPNNHITTSTIKENHVPSVTEIIQPIKNENSFNYGNIEKYSKTVFTPENNLMSKESLVDKINKNQKETPLEKIQKHDQKWSSIENSTSNISQGEIKIKDVSNKNYQYKPKEVFEVTENIRMHKNDPNKAYTDYKTTPLKKTDSPVELENSIDSMISYDTDHVQQNNNNDTQEDPLMAIRLKSNVSGDIKHINVGELNPEGTGVKIFCAATSSADSDAVTGLPSSYKISSIKIDGSFIKEPFVVKSKTEGIDYTAGYAVKQDTNGQRLRMFDQPVNYNKEDYTVSELGMEYFTNQPEAEKNAKTLIALKKSQNNTSDEVLD